MSESSATPPTGSNPPVPPQPSPSTPSQPAPAMPSAWGGDYMDWPFVKMFTQAGAPPPTRDQAIQMIQQTIKNLLSDEIERSNRIHKENMQKIKEAFEDQ